MLDSICRKVVLFSCCLILAAPALGDNLSDLSQWKIQGNTAKVTAKDGFAFIHYADPARKNIAIAPPSPITLSSDAKRLTFWWARQWGDCDFIVVVSDAAGKQHRLATHTSEAGPENVLSSPKLANQWSMWNMVQTVPFGLPAKAEVQKRFNSDAVKQIMALPWPRPLKLQRIVIAPAEVKPGKRWGGLYPVPERKAMNDLGEGKLVLTALSCETRNSIDADFYGELTDRIRWGRDDNIKLFLDDMMEARRGKLTWKKPLSYDVQVFDGYAGKLIWHQAKSLDVDLEDPISLYEDAIELPKLPVGRYFVKTLTWDGNHFVRDNRIFEYYSARGPQITGDVDPAVTGMWWESGQAAMTLPADTQTATLTCHISKAMQKMLRGNMQLQLEILDFNNRCIAQKSDKAAAQNNITFTPKPGSDYYVTATLVRGKQVLDRRQIHVGMMGEQPLGGKVSDTPQKRPTRDEFLNHKVHLQPEYRVATSFYNGSYPWFNEADPQDFDAWLKQAARCKPTSIALKAGWADVEVLPGVYRWDVLDSQVLAAGKAGMKIIFGYTPYASSPTVPMWLAAEPHQDQRGDYLDRFTYRFACTNPVYYKGRQHFWQAVAKRYGNLSWVLGYRIFTPPIISKVDPDPRRAGYSPTMQTAYAKWLKDRNLPVEKVAPFMSVNGVTYRDMPPDFSASWRHTIAFWSDCIINSDLSLAKAIRKVDPTSLIQVDRKNEPYAIERMIPQMQAMDLALKNEGAPVFRDAMLQSMCIQGGVPYLQELHRHVPTSRSIADATSYFSSLLQPDIFWLLRWTAKTYDPKSNHPINGNFARPYGYDYTVSSKPAWDTYIKGNSYEPQVLVVGSRISNQIFDERRGYYHAITGLTTYQALIEKHQVPAHFADEHCDWVDFNHFKLLFVCGQVQDKPMVDRLVSYARQGGQLVLVGDAGTYQSDGTPGTLLKRLAGLSNVSRMAQPHRMQLKRAARGWAWPFELDDMQLELLLKQAGVMRPVQVISDADPAFQVQLRKSDDGKHLYIAAMRNWHGWYRGNIEFEDELAAKWGKARGTLQINNITGKWHVKQLLRDLRDLGTITASQKTLKIQLQPALGGEVQIFELTNE